MQLFLRKNARRRAGGWWRRPWLWLALALLIAIGVSGGCAQVVAWMVVRAPNQGKRFDAAADAQDGEWKTLGVTRQMRVAVGPPDASLSVWIMDPPAAESQPAADIKSATGQLRGTVIVLHGIWSDKRQQLGVGQGLIQRGYRAVLVDLRGHGHSSGDWLTYGDVDSRDLAQLLDALAKQGLLVGKVGVYGASYGAATGLLLAGRDPRVAAVVAVAPYRSMPAIVSQHIRWNLWFGAWLSDGWIADVIARAGRLAHFDPAASNPEAAIRQTRAEVLLIHGRRDQSIPYQHSEALHAAAPDHSRLILLDDEDHNTIMFDRSGTIGREGLAWFEKWLAPGD